MKIGGVFCFPVLYFIMPTDSQYHCNVAEPCVQANLSRFFEPYARYRNCQYEPKYGLCDRYLIPQWYRIDDSMLTKCPELLSCGALYPVWMRGSLPLTSEGIVGRKACKVGFNDCCKEEIDIKIQNCGTFYAYCLSALSACSERYCFGENGSCEVPQLTEPTLHPTTASTQLPTHSPAPIHPCAKDPCIEGNVQDLSNPEERSMNCEYKQDSVLCDTHLNQGWYKSSTLMLNKCPSLLSCGAMFPVWMNGSYPSHNEGIVNAKACKRGFSNCCSKTYDIRVRNCGKYIAYCLTQLDACPERYCFGENEPCKTPDDFPNGTKSKESSNKRTHILEICLWISFAVLSLVLGISIGYGIKRLKRRQKNRSVVDFQEPQYDEIKAAGIPPPLYDAICSIRKS